MSLLNKAGVYTQKDMDDLEFQYQRYIKQLKEQHDAETHKLQVKLEAEIFDLKVMNRQLEESLNTREQELVKLNQSNANMREAVGRWQHKVKGKKYLESLYSRIHVGLGKSAYLDRTELLPYDPETPYEFVLEEAERAADQNEGVVGISRDQHGNWFAIYRIQLTNN